MVQSVEPQEDFYIGAPDYIFHRPSSCCAVVPLSNYESSKQRWGVIESQTQVHRGNWQRAHGARDDLMPEFQVDENDDDDDDFPPFMPEPVASVRRPPAARASQPSWQERYASLLQSMRVTFRLDRNESILVILFSVFVLYIIDQALFSQFLIRFIGAVLSIIISIPINIVRAVLHGIAALFSPLTSPLLDLISAASVIFNPPQKCDWSGCRSYSLLEWLFVDDPRVRVARDTVIGAFVLGGVLFFTVVCVVLLWACIGAATQPSVARPRREQEEWPGRSHARRNQSPPSATTCQRIGAAFLQGLINSCIAATLTGSPIGLVVWLFEWYLMARGESFAYRIMGLQCFSYEHDIPLGLCSMLLWWFLSFFLSFIDLIMLGLCCCQRSASERIIGARVVQKEVFA